jgi:hypothetical protein
VGVPQTRLKERIAVNLEADHYRRIDAPNQDLRFIIWLLADILNDVRTIRLQPEDQDDEEDDDS